MSSSFEKVKPFLEHILIGVAFATMGYLFFWTFNASFLAVFGMMAVCFGGLKILLGIIIYVAWIFALIFRPDVLKRKEEEARKKELEMVENSTDDFSGFVKAYWAILLEITILFIGFLVVLLTRGGVITF